MCDAHRIGRDGINSETPEKWSLYSHHAGMRLFKNASGDVQIDLKREFNLNLEVAAAPIGNVKSDVSEASIQGHF